MAVMDTHISWTDTTWNPTTGCTKVSAGCDHCYAETLSHRFGRDFETVRTHENRLMQVNRFKPIKLDDGSLRPRLVFVNSMSDLFHEDIPEPFLDLTFDKMESTPNTVYQILTKRPAGMRKYIAKRYPGRVGVPLHIWLGTSVEANNVGGRLRILRRLRDDVGRYTAFASIEPLIASCDQLDLSAIDQVLIGGESGHWARRMEHHWIVEVVELARAACSAVHFKQYGTWPNNPRYAKAPKHLPHLDRVQWAIDNGETMSSIVEGKIVGEKGGATLLGRYGVMQEKPPVYQVLVDQLNLQSALPG